MGGVQLHLLTSSNCGPSAGSYNDHIHNVIIQGGLGAKSPKKLGVLKTITRKCSFKREYLLNEFFISKFSSMGREGFINEGFFI